MTLKSKQLENFWATLEHLLGVLSSNLAQSSHAITQIRSHGYTPCQPSYYLFEDISCLIWIPTNYFDTDFQNGNLGKERVSFPSQIKYLSPAAEPSFRRAKDNLLPRAFS